MWILILAMYASPYSDNAFSSACRNLDERLSRASSCLRKNLKPSRILMPGNLREEVIKSSRHFV
ncbi:hypothetical protein ARSQ2_01538 [Arsenophonus endosymbiont of Bemisia tabaci Q2]|nr:hypothetical protein ARSQ2_01538 [Arsenophonus endosymbiont of Bemisia tabaci Q2]